MKKKFFYGLVVITVLLAAGAWYRPVLAWAFVLLGPVLLIAAYDVIQPRHTILRNYPVIGHIRYMLEDMRHHIRQYIIQSDSEGDPFNRLQRSLVYQRAKGVSDLQAFGTLQDVYREGSEWFEHSLMPLEVPHAEPRVQIGNAQCTAPYEASHLNISAMSFGALSRNAILALNHGARIGGFAHDTGEGGLSRYHLEPGGDLIWEVGTGYFGCRTPDGRFDAETFATRACLHNVKMVQLKLSQGAKPGGGGILPGAKVSADIAAARGVPVGKDVISPPRHREFDTPGGMLEFLARMRELSGGKPVGFKLCIGKRHEFLSICKAMLETGIRPDFIVIDGKEGGTGAAPVEFSDHLGVPLNEGLVFAHNALVGTGLRDDIRIIACGKIIDGFDIAAKIAMGADLCSAARAMMFALGCIQARRCHTNTCPTGIATQDPWRVQGLTVTDKSARVANYHKHTIHHLLKVLAACGIDDPGALAPEHLKRRMSMYQVSNYRDIYGYLEPGALLGNPCPPAWRDAWNAASPSAF